MEKFTLEKYLENPNVPIIDEDGRSVRIMCADFRGLCKGEQIMILGLVERPDRDGKIYNSTEAFTRQGAPMLCTSRQLYFNCKPKNMYGMPFQGRGFSRYTES